MGKDSKAKEGGGGKGKGKQAGGDDSASKGKGKAGKSADGLGTCTYVRGLFFSPFFNYVPRSRVTNICDKSSHISLKIFMTLNHLGSRLLTRR